jgi:hypothetical protein
LRSGTEGNCTVGQVLFLTEQESLQNTPAQEPSWHGVKTGVIVQLLQIRPPVGTEGGGLGETEGEGFKGGNTEGAGLKGGSTEGAGFKGGSTEGAGLSTEAVTDAIARKDENSERGLRPLDGNI